jgi:AcrR family transcriptional regulator
VAIIVNKEEKRRNIAFACKDILLTHGINNITISQIAKTAGVGKGTIYEYFENKEDIVFEIITAFISEYEKKLHAVLEINESTKEKIYHFLYLFYQDEYSNEKMTIYREFLGIAMTYETQEMIDFNKQCRKKFLAIVEEILEEGINRNEISAGSLGLASSILLFSLGLLVETHMAELDPRDEIDRFVGTLFDLIGIKENV